MKILKHEKLYRIVTCNDCGCEFQFNKKEIKIKMDGAFGYWYAYEYIECPECGHRIILKERLEENE